MKLSKEEKDNYLSPDDGLPNKHIPNYGIFDNTQQLAEDVDSKPDALNDTVSATETSNNMVKNSLYYLEHENSQLRSLNKPLQQKFRANNESNNRSRIGGLNISNAPGISPSGYTMLANSYLNMSKNTAF